MPISYKPSILHTTDTPFLTKDQHYFNMKPRTELIPNFQRVNLSDISLEIVEEKKSDEVDEDEISDNWKFWTYTPTLIVEEVREEEEVEELG
jgi:hypothetical protein